MSSIEPLASRLRRLAKGIVARAKSAVIAPTNMRPPPATPADIAYQIEYGIRNGELHIQRLSEMGISANGARILEIGPGIAFGGIAYLLAAGAKVAVADRWLAPWFSKFHGPVYSGIADKLEGVPGFDVSRIRNMVASNEYPSSAIERLCVSAEGLAQTKLKPFDAIVSNAVLEHVENLDRAFGALYSLTRPGGIGIHQVDFRDHRDFDRPLEHLLLPPHEFETLNRARHFECGSQRRQVDYAGAFNRAGFEIVTYHSNSTASAEYLGDLQVRLSRAGSMSWPREVLADLGGLFQVRRP